MKLCERLVLDTSLTDENMIYLKQLGVNHLTVSFLEMGSEEPKAESALSSLRTNPYYELKDLTALKKWVEKGGFALGAIGTPPFRNWDDIMLSGPKRDEQIENWEKTLKNMGKAGIPQLQYSWTLNAGAWIPLWRTSKEKVGRGDTEIVRFDYTKAKNAPLTSYGRISDKQMWDNLTYFLKTVIPVAEQAGVQMVLHPCDPQVPSLAGIARIIRSVESYDRVFKIVPSEANAMTFCLGCFAQMFDMPGVLKEIRHFGRMGKIDYVHFRGVTGKSLRKFDEVFPDEGKLDMIKTLKALKQAGYEGAIQPDHAPHTTGDTGYGHISHAFQIGYLKGVLQGADALD